MTAILREILLEEETLEQRCGGEAMTLEEEAVTWGEEAVTRGGGSCDTGGGSCRADPSSVRGREKQEDGGLTPLLKESLAGEQTTVVERQAWKTDMRKQVPAEPQVARMGLG